MRKTFKVQDLKAQVNSFLLHTADGMDEQRRGQICLLEGVLMDTDNYNGFSYLTASKMKDSRDGSTVGINPLPDTINSRDGNMAEKFKALDARFDGTDNTRIAFF